MTRFFLVDDGHEWGPREISLYKSEKPIAIVEELVNARGHAVVVVFDSPPVMNLCKWRSLEECYPKRRPGDDV